MKIAIISDIHDNFHNLVLAIKYIYNSEANQVICLGDFINNGIARILAKMKIPVYSIWGNNAGGVMSITRTSLQNDSNLTMATSTFDIVEFDNRKIFLTHYPLLAKPMARSGDFDAVFYGHDHNFNIEKINDCLIVNPGEISSHKTQTATLAIYDTKTNSAEIINLEGHVFTKTDLVKDHIKKHNIKFKSEPYN